MKSLTNYFFSSWIANLGVVPLFLFLAFLLCPIFTFLFSLLSLVTAVFETIFNLLRAFISSKQLNIKDRFLRQVVPYVKRVTAITLCILPFFPILSKAAFPTKGDNLLISKGQHKEIKIEALSHFSIGNSEILSTKYLKARKVLLIKGKKLGFSEVVIWLSSKKKISLNIYVLSKTRHLKIFHLIETLKHLNFSTHLKGPIIIADGIVDTLKKLQVLQNLLKDNPQSLYFRGQLDQKVKNYIYGKVFKLFFEEHIDNIKCETESIKINCFYSNTYVPSQAILTHLKKTFRINFIPLKSFDSSKNFLFKVKIIQMEKSNGESIDLGLGKLSGDLSSIFEEGIKGLIKNNKYLLEKRKIKISTLGENKGIIKLNIPSSFELFSNTNNSNTGGSFGIKVGIKLVKKEKGLELSYKTKLVTDNIKNGLQNKQASSLTITLDKSIQIFEIGLIYNNKMYRRIPFLGKIPLLGYFFRSQSYETKFKKLIGIVYLNEMKNE